MQNITIDINKQKLESKSDNNKHKSSKKLTVSDIEKLYFKDKNRKSLFGLEYERISFDKKTQSVASYEKISKIIENFASILNWELLYDGDVLIGAKDNFSTSISLEPGCQIELSLLPLYNIVDIQSEAEKILNLLDKIASVYDVVFLGYGINPKDNLEKIKIINKNRYKIMADYLPSCKEGKLCPVMMRKTAGIQVNVDFYDSKDAYLKLKFFNLIMPFMTALSANSPLENNILTSNKTNRAYAWLHTGSERCNFFYKKMFSSIFSNYKNVFKDYIKQVLNVPMVYIVRGSETILINGEINFSEFLKNGYKGYQAQIEDYILHQSLCFPDVRLKHYIEIRNHDSSNLKMALAFCAMYKGLALADISELIKKFNFLKIKNVEFYSEKIIKNGLDFKINSKYCGWDVAAMLFDIARDKLNSKERIYLRPVLDMLLHRKTQADVILEYEIDNTDSLIEHLV